MTDDAVGSDDHGADPARAGDSGGDTWSEDWGDDWDEDWDRGWSQPPGSNRTNASGLDDPRVAAGVEHLQRAAREVIAASRSLLDAAEDLVEHPDALVRITGVLADLGELAGRAARTAGNPARGRGADRERGGDRDGPDDDPPVQRIPIS